LANLAQLSATARAIATEQGNCPITGAALGSMGVPVGIELKGQSVLLCCAGCKAEATAKPGETLAKVKKFKEAAAHGHAAHPVSKQQSK
jgi:hypothetical protein